MTTYYTSDHEWIRIEGDTATVGITTHAATQLNGVVYVELPEPGSKFEQKQEFSVVENSKTVSGVFAPVSGTILEANTPLIEAPERIDEDPEGGAWLIRMKIDNPDELSSLMDKAAYDAFCAGR